MPTPERRSVFLPYQIKAIESTNRFDVAVKSRQIGFTFAHAFKKTKLACFHNRPQLIVSASQRQSNRVMSYVSRFIDEFNRYFNMHKFVSVIKDTQTEIVLSNNCHIMCFPANPDTIRGFDGDVLLDEFALYKNDRQIYESILPSITGGFVQNKYNVNIISTPLGLTNMFSDIYNDDGTRFRDYRKNKITIHDAIRDGFDVNVDDIRANIDDESFRQEYECEFVDESTSYFPFELLKSVFQDYNEFEIKGRTTIGVDIGRTRDRTSIAVVTDMAGVLWLKSIEVMHNKPFPVQYETIANIIRNNAPDVVLVDRGAVGMQLAESLESNFPNCAGVNFTDNLKSEMVTFAKRLMEQNKFRCNVDRDIMNEFHRIKRVNINNTVKFQSPRDKSGHGDRAWSIMLALHATKINSAFKMSFI